MTEKRHTGSNTWCSFYIGVRLIEVSVKRELTVEPSLNTLYAPTLPNMNLLYNPSENELPVSTPSTNPLPCQILNPPSSYK